LLLSFGNNLEDNFKVFKKGEFFLVDILITKEEIFLDLKKLI